MSRPIRHADLLARALGELTGAERERVDSALAADAALRQEFESIAGHLLQYEHLPPAPPPPPFAQIEAALDDGSTPDLGVLRLQDAPPRRRSLTAVTALAALLLAAVLVWRPWDTRQGSGELIDLVAGRGMQLLRAGSALPAPAHAKRTVQRGDVLHCLEAAEARLGERIRIVLDGGARLRIESGERVALQEGRAWFEVAPGAFEVETPHGPVRVLGTAFEVDLRAGGLEVAVAHGRVRAAAQEIAQGEQLSQGQVSSLTGDAGAWFQRPSLLLEAGSGPQPTLTRPLTLRVVFFNPGNVPLTLPGPAAARSPLWISFETLAGRVLRELPVLEAHVTSGREVLRAGHALDLGPGARQTVTLKILPPVGSPGAYRCRALYRPEGQPGVLSTPLDVEVR